MQKNLVLIAKYFKRIYKPTNNNLKTSSNSRNKNVDTTQRYKNDNQSGQFGNQRTMNVAGARENVGSPVVQQSGIQFFNCKEFDTDEEIDEQELEAHYSYIAKIQEVPKADSGTDSELLEQNDQNDVESDDEHVALANLIGKSVETKFVKPFVVLQPNAQRIPKPSVLGKPALFLDSLERKYFSKTKSVPKTKVSEGLSKTITAQTLPQTARQAVSNINVLKPGMYQIDYRTTQTRAPQSPQTFRNTNPRMSNSTGVNHKTNVSIPQLRSNQMKDKVVPNNSQVKLKKTQVEDHPRIPSIANKIKSVTTHNDSLNSKTSNANAVCATCGKCLVDSDHFACVTKMLNDMNARTKKPNVEPISTRKPKGHANKSVATPHKRKVALKSTTQKPKSYYRMLYEKTSKFAPILGYEDLVQENITSNRVYYIEGLNHNLFLVGQFCDADLDVAFRKSTCFIRDLQGNNLLIDAHVSSQQELDLLFGPLYDEFFTAGTSSFKKSSSPTNNSNQQDIQPITNIQPTSKLSTPTFVHAEENNVNEAEEEHLLEDEFTNPFYILVQEVDESSSHNIGNSNVHEFNQPQVSKYRWTKDHPLEQVHVKASANKATT
nr:integrase, catalytic region, zinc finger, CCHC-type, peptidase aspartic, catalytic [Tanacetum cinerariifolium]